MTKPRVWVDAKALVEAGRAKEGHRWGLGVSYDDIAAQFGTSLLTRSFGSYQGDEVHIIERDGALGLLVFAYGSCSGCDALEACGNVEDLQALVDQLAASIKWVANRAEMWDLLQQEITTKGQSLNWYANDEEFVAFVEAARGLLCDGRALP